MGFYGGPAPKTRAMSPSMLRNVSRGFKEGDRVRVVRGGPMFGWTGKVEFVRPNDGNLVIHFDADARDTITILSAHDVEPEARARGGGGATATSDRTRRARFDQLRARYMAADKKIDDLEDGFRSKYGGPWQLSWLKMGDRKKLEAARTSRDKAGDAMFSFVQSISPRDWSKGVPAHWIYEKLSYEDAVRPLSERLSVTPPLSYGQSSPMR